MVEYKFLITNGVNHKNGPKLILMFHFCRSTQFLNFVVRQLRHLSHLSHAGLKCKTVSGTHNTIGKRRIELHKFNNYNINVTNRDASVVYNLFAVVILLKKDLHTSNTHKIWWQNNELLWSWCKTIQGDALLGETKKLSMLTCIGTMYFPLIAPTYHFINVNIIELVGIPFKIPIVLE